MIQERLGALFRKRSRDDDDLLGAPVPGPAATTTGRSRPATGPEHDDDPAIDVVSLAERGDQTWEDLLSEALHEPAGASPGGRSAGVGDDAGGAAPAAPGPEVAVAEGDRPTGPRVTPAGSTTLARGRRIVRYRIELDPPDDAG
ncbi:MAG: hypothetical protein GEV08_06265 [Acidimicrobiia bacterium]|nr:hypothetical protein [Acidimicrobiia bacterium]